jgi:secreted Zn-dependent insulinase-like peptidase
VLHVPYYESIRTQQQLGYLVWSFFYYDTGISSFCCVVQSPQKDPVYVDGRIEEFLKSFETELAELPDEEFQNHIDALVSTKLQKYNKLSEEVKDYWEEIINQTYQFTRSMCT